MGFFHLHLPFEALGPKESVRGVSTDQGWILTFHRPKLYVDNVRM